MPQQLLQTLVASQRTTTQETAQRVVTPGIQTTTTTTKENMNIKTFITTIEEKEHSKESPQE